MPARLRRLSGSEVIRALRSFGFEAANQRVSHVKLRRLAGERRQVPTVPAHAELDPGTLRAIFRQACRLVPEQELRPCFFSGEPLAKP
jgi:predicted RNA binding protein YcfA (HicA-like mRNA interferase family)